MSLLPGEVPLTEAECWRQRSIQPEVIDRVIRSFTDQTGMPSTEFALSISEPENCDWFFVVAREIASPENHWVYDDDTGQWLKDAQISERSGNIERLPPNPGFLKQALNAGLERLKIRREPQKRKTAWEHILNDEDE